jgi:hypothetical protein
MLNTVLERPVPSFPQTAPDATHIPTTQIDSITSARLAAERYREWLALPTDELRDRAAAELVVEALATPERRRELARERLLAWLELDGEDARILARTYDEATASLEPEQRNARYEAERDAILHGLSFRQFQQLADTLPWLRSTFGLALIGTDPAVRMPDAA